MRNLLLILILGAASFVPSKIASQVIISIDTMAVHCNSGGNTLVTLPVRVANFVSVGSFQFTLGWDVSKLQFSHTSGVLPPFTTGFGPPSFDTTTFLNQGLITFSWTGLPPNGLTAPDGSIVFSITFDYQGGSFANCFFPTTGFVPTSFEVTDTQGNPVPAAAIDGGATDTDTEPPTIGCPANLTVMANGPVAVTGIAPSNVSDNCGTPEVGWESVGASNYAFSVDPDASGSVFAPGLTTVFYTATDNSNNQANCLFNILIETPPVQGPDTLTVVAGTVSTNCGSPLNFVNISVLNFDTIGSLQFSVNWNKNLLRFDSVGNFHPLLQIDLNNFNSLQALSDGLLGFQWTIFSANGLTLNDGTVLFRIYFSQTANQVGSTAIGFGNVPVSQEAYTSTVSPAVPTDVNFTNGNYSVVDNTPPSIVCPADVVLVAASGQSSVPVTGTLPTVSDACSSPNFGFVRTGATSGTGVGNADGNYNVGATTVTYTALDASGLTSTCTFLVTVNDPGAVVLSLDTVQTDCQSGATQITVALRVRNFNPVVGMTFNVAWDETVLELDTINYGPLGPNFSIFPQFFQDRNDGVFHFFGGAVFWPDIPNDGIFMTFTFTVLNPSGSTNIDFINLPNLPTEVLDANTDPLNFLLNNGYFDSGLDAGPPMLAPCPADVTVSGGAGCEAIVNLAAPTATDDCSPSVSVTSNPVGNIFTGGTTTVVFTATDLAGNSSTCSVMVSVTDLEGPTLTCQSDISVNTQNNECSASVTLMDPIVSDNCSSNLTATSDHPATAYDSGETLVTYTATDGNGNTGTCTVLVTVLDNQPPQITQCPTGVTLNALTGQCSRVVTWPSPVISGCGSTSFNIDIQNPPNTPFPIGETTVVYTVTDTDNLTATCSFVVRVNDVTPPILVCPNNLTVGTDAGSCEATALWDLPQVADDCSSISSLTSSINLGDPLPIGSNSITYTAVDGAMNSISCTFTVKVEDHTPPVLGACPPDLTVAANTSFVNLGCGRVISWAEPTLTSTCNQSGNLLISNFQPGDFFPLGGPTEVKYMGFNANGFSDSCSFFITVADSTAPVFVSVPPNTTINLPANSCEIVTNWPAPVVNDICSMPPVVCVPPSGVLFGPGPHVILCTATDPAGNQVMTSFSIDVKDVTAPVISNCPSDVTVSATSNCEATVTWPEIMAADNCDLTVDLQPTGLLTGGTFPTGDSILNFIASDDFGNNDTCKVKITVTGAQNPQGVCPPNQLFTGCDSGPVTWVSPVFSGFCGTPEIDSTHAFGNFPLGVTTVVYTADDGSMNVASCSFTITVNESVPPSFDCPQNIVVNVGGQILSDPSGFLDSAKVVAGCAAVLLFFENPTANDNCTNVVVAQISGGQAGTEFQPGITTMSFRATDVAQNSANCTFTIRVEGLAQPSVNISPNPGCLGEMVVVEIAPIPGATYEWSGPNGVLASTTNQVLIDPVSASDVGFYTAVATVGGCKTAPASDSLDMVTKPVAVDDFTFEVNAGEVLDSIDVLVNDNVWGVGDAFASLLAPVTGVSFDQSTQMFVFSGREDPGTVTFLYSVCSKTCNDLCDTGTVVITVQDSRCNFIPNVITPNGDGDNDDFFIPCLQTELYKDNVLTIYNQWGDVVFEASPYLNGPTTGFKGTLNGEDGKDLPDGVYYYVFKTSKTANAQVFKGFIEIVR